MKPILLQCYLRKYGDVRHNLILTSDGLWVRFKGVTKEFGNDQISGMVVQRKKLIIPLVLGGIGTSFTLLSLSLGWYHYQLNLFAVFLFFGWMYYGFLGRDALVIPEKGGDNIFLLGTNTAMVREFVRFVKERIWKIQHRAESVIFHVTTDKILNEQSNAYYYSHPSLQSEGFIHCSTLDQLEQTLKVHFQPEDELVLVVLNPKWLLEEVKWEYSANRNSDFPHIYGKINKSAMIRLIRLSPEEFSGHILETFT